MGGASQDPSVLKYHYYDFHQQIFIKHPFFNVLFSFLASLWHMSLVPDTE